MPQIRVVGASEGDPYDPHTMSGSACYLLDALERQYDVVERVDYRLHGWRRGIAALASVRLPRARWADSYHRNRVTLFLRSRRLRAELEQVGKRYDLVVQVYGWVEPHDHPYVLYLDAVWHEMAESWPPWLPSRRPTALPYWYEVERRMFRAARHLFTSSRRVTESLVGFYGIPESQITVVGGGVNFPRLPAVRELRQRDPIILFVGRDFARKGVDRLVEAFRSVRERVPNARLVVVGCKGVAEEEGVQVLGYVKNRVELEGLYTHAQVFCLPSRFDPHPNVLAEAMAYGLPCVGTTVGGIPDIILDGQTGLLVPPDDNLALASALLRLLQDSDYASSLGAAGRARVETELNWDRVAERMGPGLARAVRSLD